MRTRDELAEDIAIAMCAGYLDPHATWSREGIVADAAELADSILYRRASSEAAPYVPKVGDYVETHTHTKGVYLGEIDGVDEVYVIEAQGGPVGLLWYARPFKYLRPATPAELAPAGLATVDERLVVGAVVSYIDSELIVTKEAPDDGRHSTQTWLKEASVNGAVLCASKHDHFVRWATPAECARHGIPYVDRTPPAPPAASERPPTEARDNSIYDDAAEYLSERVKIIDAVQAAMIGKYRTAFELGSRIAFILNETNPSVALDKNPSNPGSCSTHTRDEVRTEPRSWSEVACGTGPGATTSPATESAPPALDEAGECEMAEASWFVDGECGYLYDGHRNYVAGWLAAKRDARGGA